MDEHADAMIDALCDILVEKGVITEDELYDRVAARLYREDAEAVKED